MQIRHACRGDEAALACLLEKHERHYRAELRPGAGTEEAEFLTGGGTLCLVAEDGDTLVGFAILNPCFPGPRLTQGLFLKEPYVAAAALRDGYLNLPEAEQRCRHEFHGERCRNAGSQRVAERHAEQAAEPTERDSDNGCPTTHSRRPSSRSHRIARR